MVCYSISVVVNNDKRWYTSKLLVSLEIPRGNFPYETPGEGGVGGGGTHFYAILGCTAVQGSYVTLSSMRLKTA